MTQERKIYSLTQLNQSLENHFWKNFGESYFWVTAEIISINEKSGHHYLELADAKNGNTTARSFGTIWASNYSVIVSQIGKSETEALLKPGNKVLFNIKIEFHAVYGLKLKIREIDPAYSYGEIERKRQEVIKRLKKEGIFDLQRDVKLPTIIKRIALIGSPETSGFRDFQNELLNNHDFNNFKIKVFSVRVQGEYAAEEIRKAVEEANLYDADAIVVLRGGGSKMDLAIFDDYDLAAAICHSRLPVITGIGHETDKVVADMVANVFFITPTAVARHIHYAITSYWEIMRGFHDKAIQLSQQLLSIERSDFTHVNNYLVHHSRALIHYWKTEFQQRTHDLSQISQQLIYSYRDHLAKQGHELQYLLNNLVQTERNELSVKLSQVSYGTENVVYMQRSHELPSMIEKVKQQSLNIIDQQRITFNNQVELLELLNPNKILKTGYTISTIDDVDAREYAGELIGKELKTLTDKELITSKITSTKNIENGN
ncbi:MAG: exodeoxyribonuclease VII large subunit [Fluviicola sp.]|nr:MAG: exodeoxyribonuclease VII large subunit [Fluviicola sp.]